MSRTEDESEDYHWELVDRERAPKGGDLMLLHDRGEYLIRVGKDDLMWSGSSFSEEEMARVAIRRLGDRPRPRVLIGGLGMGFTTRAALDSLPTDGEVVVAEIVPAVVSWNQGPLAHLAQYPLRDPRTRIELADVRRFIAETPAPFDAILLDVDNGPFGLTRPANQLLYGDAALANAHRALTPGGILAIWSATSTPAFLKRLRHAGFEADSIRVPERGPYGGLMHTLFFGRTSR